MNFQLNPNMVLLARQSRGYTQDELSGLLDISQGKLSKIEQGLQDASDDLLERFSQVLHYPNSFFFTTANILPASTPFNFRKKASLKTKAQDLIEAKANICRIRVRKLLESVELDSKIFHLDLEAYGDNAEKIAETARQAMGIPKGPIINLTRLLEDAGIVIIHQDFQTSDLSGFTIQDGSSHPIIFINKAMPGDRQRFTIAHELGHIIMHNIMTPDMEQQADAFASAFLMPARDIAPMLSPISFKGLANLKLYWKVSMGALLMRAKSLGILSDSASQYWWKQMAIAGYKTQEPPNLSIPIEQPLLLKELVETHLKELGYSREDLCKILGCFEDEFWPFLNGAEPHLRILRTVN